MCITYNLQMSNKITVLKIRMHGDEDDVYVFDGWHTINDVTPFIKNWVSGFDLDYDDEGESWFKDVYRTNFDKLV